MGKTLLGLCLLLTIPTAALALLIVLPAPTYGLFLASVGISEWSLWPLAVATIALILALVSWHVNRWVAGLGIILNMLAICCTLLPIVTAWQAAREAGVSLSIRRYIAGAPTVSVRETHDLPFAKVNDQTLKLDVYQPAAQPTTGRLPAVVVVHGGSWNGGDKGDYPAFNRWLAAGQRVVFDVQYRLAEPRHHFPAQVADVKCAIGWVKQHADQYGIDPDRLALIGRSAGGQLALLAAYTPNDPALPAACPATDTSVRAVVSFYGPTDLVWGYYHPAQPDLINGPRVLENYLGGAPATVPDTYALAAPIEHVSTAPPSLFLHGGHDQLVGHQHVDRILPRLKADGIPYDYLYLPWANHGFDYNFNGWGSQVGQAMIARFLDRYLR